MDTLDDWSDILYEESNQTKQRVFWITYLHVLISVQELPLFKCAALFLRVLVCFIDDSECLRACALNSKEWFCSQRSVFSVA